MTRNKLKFPYLCERSSAAARLPAAGRLDWRPGAAGVKLAELVHRVAPLARLRSGCHRSDESEESKSDGGEAHGELGCGCGL